MVCTYPSGEYQPDEVHGEAGPAGSQLHAGDTQAGGQSWTRIRIRIQICIPVAFADLDPAHTRKEKL